MQVTVTPIDFFEAPTVAGLALTITELQARQDDAEMTALLTELENLSEEEAQRILSEEQHHRASFPVS